MYLKVTLIIVFSYLYLAFGNEIERHEDTVEVPVGETIILHCKSNDDNHNFMFWHLTNGEVIGPRNDFDNTKFKYEVLTGNLTIKGITENDAGTYSCISDGVDNRDVSVHSVNLQVKNEWEIISNKEKESTNHKQNNKNGNLWKVSAILGCIVLLLVMILLGIHFYHKDVDKPKYFDIIEQNDEEDDEDDEDSTEELFTREPSTSGINKESNEGSDNFEKVYTTINMNNNT